MNAWSASKWYCVNSAKKSYKMIQMSDTIPLVEFVTDADREALARSQENRHARDHRDGR